MRTVRDELWDGKGNLLSRRERVLSREEEADLELHERLRSLDIKGLEGTAEGRVLADVLRFLGLAPLV